MKTVYWAVLLPAVSSGFFNGLPLSIFPRNEGGVVLQSSSDVESRVERFRSAVGYAKSLETGFEGCRTYTEETDPQVQGCMLVKAAIDVAAKRDPNKTLFIQTVTEIAESLSPLFAENIEWFYAFKHILEPERFIQFRVPWVDDKGRTRINRGYRVQFSSALGPYKGGLRFHPSVTADTVKFLGFEQIFKNSLTTLALGGGKGGSDFDPKGKSEGEVMRFCQSFMTALYTYIGPSRDVPAGDIGVGGKEIGYLFGQYKRLNQGNFEGVLTGKSADWGGSNMRPEATGYGCVFFAEEAMKDLRKKELKGMKCAVSGSGNVAQFAAEMLLKEGATVLTFSDSSGTIYEPDGFSKDQLRILMKLKQKSRGARVSDYCISSPSAKYFEKRKPWGIVESLDLAFPCATQNEIGESDAQDLVDRGCIGVFEGANMPTTPEGVHVLESNKVVFGPAKAANAGGVAVSGLEMAQNAQQVTWSSNEVETMLRKIMKDIYKQCAECAKTYWEADDLKSGANIAGFLKVAAAMREQGAV